MDTHYTKKEMAILHKFLVQFFSYTS